MNARGEKRAWVHDKVCEVKKSLLTKHRGQVQVTFSESSRSKADNLNVFGEQVSTEKFDYALVYDIDDRPTYSERSLLKCAQRLIGMKRNGLTIVGLQGPCIDCFENEAGLGEMVECQHEWFLHMVKHQVFDRCTGHIWCQGSNFIAETWVFKKYKFNPSLLCEDQGWSVDLLKDGFALANFSQAVSYGQGSSRKKRRRRWDKGHMQLCSYIIQNMPMSYFILPAKCWAYWTVFWYFVTFPTIIMLTLFGFRVCGRNCLSQTGTPFFLDPDQMTSETMSAYGVRSLVWVWNHIGFTNFVVLVGIIFGHGFNTLKFWHRGQFLNARRGCKWFFLQFGYTIFDTLLLVFPILDYKAQVKQFHFTDMLLDFVFGRLPAWEPTEKKSQVRDYGNKCIGKDSTTTWMGESFSDEDAADDDSPDDCKDMGPLKATKTLDGTASASNDMPHICAVDDVSDKVSTIFLSFQQ